MHGASNEVFFLDISHSSWRSHGTIKFVLPFTVNVGDSYNDREK